MSDARDGLHERLAHAIVDLDAETSARLAEETLEAGIDASATVEQGLNRGMQSVGMLFERHEYFIPEMLLAADAMQAALAVLKPHLRVGDWRMSATVVLGVVEGDNHDIGKNLVKAMLEASGFTVVDLGSNVATPRFVKAVRESTAAVVGVSALMTTTMDRMEAVVASLASARLRDRCKVMVGGAPVSVDFARRIGADGYAPDAAAAVREVRRLLSAVD